LAIELFQVGFLSLAHLYFPCCHFSKEPRLHLFGWLVLRMALETKSWMCLSCWGPLLLGPLRKYGSVCTCVCGVGV
jgi:hypothetical protein